MSQIHDEDEVARELRASEVSMVYQEPGRALNPSLRVGRQVAEVYEVAGLDHKVAREAFLRDAQSAGLKLVTEHDFLPYQYFLVLQP